MNEWVDKYRDVDRLQTNSWIDKPMILFFGLTLFDFIAGVVVFLIIVMNLDSGWSFFISIFAAFAATGLSKFYRVHFPNRFLMHLNWSLGIQKHKSVPTFFKRSRFKIYGP